jgi:chemotaxis protein MotB
MDSPRSTVSVKDRLGSPVEPPSATPPNGKTSASDAPDVAEAHRIAEADEARKLESLMLDLRQAISQSQALEPFKDQLLLDITPEGLRIQIVDQQNRAMFDLGSSRLKDYTDRILEELAVYLNSVPNRISVTGHTDITPYTGRSDYSNWELSADRANAARRALLNGGLRPEKIARVVGLSSAVLFDKEHPNDPVNRRISIVVMTKRAEEAALRTDEMPQNAAAPELPAESTATAGAAGAGAAPVSVAGTTAGAPPLASVAASAAPGGAAKILDGK